MAMEARTVYEMLNNIREEMSKAKEDMKKEITKIIEEKVLHIPQDLQQQCKDAALQNFSDELEADRKRVQALEKSLYNSQLQNKVMASVIDNMSMQIMDLTSRMDNIEVSNARNNITIIGLQAPDDKMELLETIHDFFPSDYAN